MPIGSDSTTVPTCCDTGMRSNGWAHDRWCEVSPGSDKGTRRLDGTLTPVQGPLNKPERKP